MRKSYLLPGLIAAGAVALIAGQGCTSTTKNTSGAGGSGGTGVAATNAVTNGVTATQSSTSSSMVTDESTSCADAVVLEVTGQNQFEGDIYRLDDLVLGEPGDEDFFLIEVEAGSWWTFTTDANPDDIPENIDTVLSLYNADGTELIAEVDDSFPRASTDSELYHRFEEGGTYCIKIEEFSAWNGDPAEGGPNFIYAMIGIPIDFAKYPQSVDDVEPNENTTDADTNGLITVFSPQDTDQWFTNLLGGLDTAGDVDVYAFVAPTDAVGYSLDLTPSTPNNGYGSTGGPGLVSLLDGTGTLLSQLDNGAHEGLGGINANIVAGETYYVQVERPAGSSPGSNDFYVLKTSTSDINNPQEGGGGTVPLDDQSNDIIDGAEVVASTPNGETVSTFIGGELPEGDVDYWTFDAAGMPADGTTLAVVCSSWAAGSGVRGMTVTFEDMAGNTTTFSQDEDEVDGILWSDSTLPGVTAPAIQISGDGPFFIKLENDAATTDGAATATNYLCGLHVTSGQ